MADTDDEDLTGCGRQGARRAAQAPASTGRAVAVILVGAELRGRGAPATSPAANVGSGLSVVGVQDSPGCRAVAVVTPILGRVLADSVHLHGERESAKVFQQFLDSPERVVIEFTPDYKLSFDSELMWARSPEALRRRAPRRPLAAQWVTRVAVNALALVCLAR